MVLSQACHYTFTGPRPQTPTTTLRTNILPVPTTAQQKQVIPKPRAEHPIPDSAPRYQRVRQSQGKADQSPAHVPPRKAFVSSQRGRPSRPQWQLAQTRVNPSGRREAGLSLRWTVPYLTAGPGGQESYVVAEGVMRVVSG